MKDDVNRQSSFDARKVDSSALLSLTFSKCLRGQSVMEEFLQIAYVGTNTQNGSAWIAMIITQEWNGKARKDRKV